MNIDGIDIPIAIEAAGPEAIEAYIAERRAARAVPAPEALPQAQEQEAD